MKDTEVIPAYVPLDDRCKCDHGYLSLGKMHGINMGKGWVRTGTHPLCPVHALCQHYTKAVRAERWNGRWLYCNVHKTKDCPQ